MFIVMALCWHCGDTVVTVVLLCSLRWHFLGIVVALGLLWWYCGHYGGTGVIVVALC